jgi:hypothetical protein
MTDQLATALINAGPMGMFVLYLIWDRQSGRSERQAYDRERLETDKAIASVLAAIKAMIEARH